MIGLNQETYVTERREALPGQRSFPCEGREEAGVPGAELVWGAGCETSCRSCRGPDRGLWFPQNHMGNHPEVLKAGVHMPRLAFCKGHSSCGWRLDWRGPRSG